MAMSCRTCGTLNPDHSTLCEYCGASLPTPTPRRDPFVQRHPSQSTPAYPPTMAYAVSYPVRGATKDPSAGLLIELLPGLFGFLGIGYLWAGETALGLALLLGYWAFWAIVAVVTILSFGLLLCFLPFFILLYLAAPIVSALLLQRRLRSRQAVIINPYGTSPY
ncbi:MAG TPA: hypothetical protein VIL85_00835 [Thermomicrobiales bacterium]